jgi:tripartite-type tricarboxylate transporter receptor subunit TctC
MLIRRRAALAAALAAPGLARAQEPWPTRPIRIVIPVAPGGLTDTTGRAVAEALGTALGQPVVVENRAGGGTTVGAAAVAQARDGHSFLLNTSSQVVVPLLTPNLPFDAERDFAPVTQLGTLPLTLAVRANHPAGDVRGFIEAARRAPGTISIGHAGNASAGHLAAALFQARAGIRLIEAPYRGGAEAARDIAAGVIDSGMVSLVAITPHVQGGRARLLAVTGARRSVLLPEVPTIGEMGVADYAIEEWTGLFAPAGTPAPVLARLQQAVARVLAEPEVQRRFAALGAEAVGSTPEAFARFLAAERETARRLIREADIRASRREAGVRDA